MRRVLAAVEGGGTKFVCMVGTGPNDVLDEVTIPTTDPTQTLGAVVEFLQKPRSGIEVAAVGIAHFGPIGLDPTSADYGSTLATTKVGWSHVRVVAPIARRLGVPVGWDTDVNGAVLGEARWGAGPGIDPLLYLTIGTGIGGGAIVNGAPIHGLVHPEMGHVPVPTLPGDTYPGYCTFHGRCLEGVASGPALADRCGRPLAEVPPDDPVWELTARYLAYGLSTFVVTLSPRRIILGGGVMNQVHLLPHIRRYLVEIMNGYVQGDEFARRVDDYIVPAQLGQKAGLFGALVLAEQALARSGESAPTSA